MALKNQRPEKSVENDIIIYAASMGIVLFKYESKATYSKTIRRYKKSASVVEGHPDLAGFNKNGVAYYIEIKTPKTKSVRYHQKLFILRALACYCVAGVVWDRESFDKLLSASQLQRIQMVADLRVA